MEPLCCEKIQEPIQPFCTLLYMCFLAYYCSQCPGKLTTLATCYGSATCVRTHTGNMFGGEVFAVQEFHLWDRPRHFVEKFLWNCLNLKISLSALWPMTGIATDTITVQVGNMYQNSSMNLSKASSMEDGEMDPGFSSIYCSVRNISFLDVPRFLRK